MLYMYAPVARIWSRLYSRGVGRVAVVGHGLRLRLLREQVRDAEELPVAVVISVRDLGQLPKLRHEHLSTQGVNGTV